MKSKVFFIIAIFISTSCFAKTVYIYSNSSLAKELEELAIGETLTIHGSLAGSFENQILEKIRDEIGSPSPLEDFAPLTFEEYREMILESGCTILYTEVRRDLALPPFTQYLPPLLGVERIVRPFLAEITSSQLIYRELFMLIIK